MKGAFCKLIFFHWNYFWILEKKNQHFPVISCKRWHFLSSLTCTGILLLQIIQSHCQRKIFLCIFFIICGCNPQLLYKCMNLKYINSDTLFHFYSYTFNFTFISCPVQYRFYFLTKPLPTSLSSLYVSLGYHWLYLSSFTSFKIFSSFLPCSDFQCLFFLLPSASLHLPLHSSIDTF